MNTAKRKLPKFVFDFVAGGAGDEKTLIANCTDFERINLLPSITSKSGPFSLQTEIAGENWSAPFGVAPMGLCGLIHPEADIILANVAAEFNIPYVLSCASNHSIQTIKEATGKAPWFQLYIPKIKPLLWELIENAESTGCPVLIVTVDTQTPGIRWRDRANGLSLPYKLNMKNLLDVIKCPAWAYRYLKNPYIKFPNYEHLLNDGQNHSFSEMMSLQTGGSVDWELLSLIRQKWPGTLILKGVMSSDVAIEAKSIGIDHIIVSNHGGRQLDGSPSAIQRIMDLSILGLNKNVLMLDSGIRSGADVIKAICQGASFTFLGRPLLFALAAQGETGVRNLLSTFKEEVEVNLKLMGVYNIGELTKNNTIYRSFK